MPPLLDPIDDDRPPDHSAKKILECLLCFERYSVKQILAGEYQLETMICSYCYAKMQQAPYEKSCFGKPSQMINGVKKHLGYNPLAPECRERCPDRNVCRRIMQPKTV